jgi:hypothetical protein
MCWAAGDCLEDIDPEDLPELTPEHIAATSEALRQFGYAEPKRLPEQPATFVCDNKRGREYSLGVLRGVADELASLRSGRNTCLNWASGRAFSHAARSWLSDAEIWSALWNAGVANGMIAENSESAFVATFRSGMRYGLAHPAADPPERLTADPALAARFANLQPRAV